jgi:hypothetical protein
MIHLNNVIELLSLVISLSWRASIFWITKKTILERKLPISIMSSKVIFHVFLNIEIWFKRESNLFLGRMVHL